MITIKELAKYRAEHSNSPNSKRDATIYVDRKTSGASLRELGKIYHLTPERIRQICFRMSCVVESYKKNKVNGFEVAVAARDPAAVERIGRSIGASDRS